MDFLSKCTLAALALATSGITHAEVVNGASGNGQLVLFVKNQTTGNVYARGLNLFVDDFVTASQVAADTYSVSPTLSADMSFTFALNAPIGPDANLQGFLNGTDTFQWTVIAGDTVGGFTAGDLRYVFTAQGPVSTGGGVLSTNWTQINDVWNQLNPYLPDSGPDNSTPVDGQWDQAGTLGAGMDSFWVTFAGNERYNNRNPLGSAANLYAMTANGGSGGLARIYQLGQFRLTTDGTLENVAATVVPLPSAMWLFGSAIATFAGFARRRRTGGCVEPRH